MSNLGFYFDMDRCIGCKTCQIACKDVNDLKVGTIYRKVAHFETGKFPPYFRVQLLSILQSL